MTTDRTGELKLLENMSRDFALNELREGREERDTHPFAPLDLELLRKAEELGYFSLLIEEPGAPSNLTDLGHVLKNLSMEDAALAGAVFAHSLAQMTVIQAGNAEMLNKLDGGKKTKKKECASLIAFPCFDFPQETARGLRAVKKGRKYLLTGKAEYVVLGGLAGWVLLPAYLEDAEGFSLFLCSLDSEGVEAGPAVLSLGLRSCPAVDLVLNDAAVSLVGKKGEGEKYCRSAAELLAASASAISLGVMKGSFREALEYAQQRIQGGREIINWSEVRMILSNMALECRTGEMLVDKALWECEARSPGWEISAGAAALQVQEMACRVVTDGVQILGGNGYMRDYGQEKRFRDAHQLKVLLGHHPLRKLEFLTAL